MYKVIVYVIVTFVEDKVSSTSDVANGVITSAPSQNSVTDSSKASNQSTNNENNEGEDGSSAANNAANNASNNTNNTPPSSTQAPATAPVTTTTTKKQVSVYKNGTYAADGSYGTPEGQVAINVSVTLLSDIITDANVTSVSGDRTSVRYQNKFISGYKQYVVGKNIADVQLSRVSGSSLTPEGFNSALATIKAQAKS